MSSKQTATPVLGKAPPLREDTHGVIPYTGSLYDIETTLLALIEVDPEELTPELRAEYERDLQEAIRKAPEKRERVAIKLFDLGQRAAVKMAAAKAHIEKAEQLRLSAERYERDADRLKNYVLDVMRELPKPKKGCRTLEGTSATFKAKGVADSVEITDEAALPDQYKTATVSMSIESWRLLLALPAFNDIPVDKVTWGRVPSSDIRAALQAEVKCPKCGGAGDLCPAGPSDAPMEVCDRCEGAQVLPATVSGARLITGKLRLEVS